MSIQELGPCASAVGQNEGMAVLLEFSAWRPSLVIIIIIGYIYSIHTYNAPGVPLLLQDSARLLLTLSNGASQLT